MFRPAEPTRRDRALLRPIAELDQLGPILISTGAGGSLTIRSGPPPELLREHPNFSRKFLERFGCVRNVRCISSPRLSEILRDFPRPSEKFRDVRLPGSRPIHPAGRAPGSTTIHVTNLASDHVPGQTRFVALPTRHVAFPRHLAADRQNATGALQPCGITRNRVISRGVRCKPDAWQLAAPLRQNATPLRPFATLTCSGADRRSLARGFRWDPVRGSTFQPESGSVGLARPLRSPAGRSESATQPPPEPTGEEGGGASGAGPAAGAGGPARPPLSGS